MREKKGSLSRRARGCCGDILSSSVDNGKLLIAVEMKAAIRAVFPTASLVVEMITLHHSRTVPTLESCRAAYEHDPTTQFFSLVIVFGLFLSYCPQFVRIYRAKSSQGIALPSSSLSRRLKLTLLRDSH